jgi:hypothetical protein
MGRKEDKRVCAREIEGREGDMEVRQHVTFKAYCLSPFHPTVFFLSFFLLSFT